MKKLFYILAVAALAAGVVGCQKVKEEDAFSKAPVAPELYSHADILITNNTMDEEVTFTWSNYRFLPESLDYTLYVAYGDDDPVVFATTKDLYVTMSKRDFRTLLFQKLTGLPQNDLFTLRFYVSVMNGEKEYRSQEVVLSVYGNGDAVAPVIEEVMPDTELDPSNPGGEVSVMSWEPARLVYGETVTYDVYVSLTPANAASLSISLRDVAEPKKIKLTEEPLTGTSYITTVDKLNEAIIALGGVEGAVNNVTFEVIAMCESLPNGVAAATAEVAVTTYQSTFPEVLYIPGSHQGWQPAKASTIKLSKTVKGFYQGIVDLTTPDGSDAYFKFSPFPEWKDDFGGVVEVKEKGSGDYPVAEGTLGSSENIVVPSGVYYIEMSLKFKTITMVQLNTLSLIGEAVGSWDADIDLEFNADEQVFRTVTTFQPGEFKLRFNHNWDMALGEQEGAGYTLAGENIKNDKTGEYRLELNVATVPFTIKFVNTSFPDKLYVPGSHNDWSHAQTVLNGNGEGQYEGFIKIGGQWGFKLTDKVGWESDGAQVWGQDPVTNAGKNNRLWTTYSLIQGGGNIAQTEVDGDKGEYCYVVIDLDALTVSMVPVTSVSIIGGFDGWKNDFDMTYDADKDVWTISDIKVESKNTEFKFRSNHNWDVKSDEGQFDNPNLGGNFADLKEHNDGNCVIAERGVYSVTLSIATTPFKAEVVKTGDVDGPAAPDNMYLVGSGIVDWDTFIPMTPFHSQAGMFWSIRYLEAGAIFKFSPNPGWVGDFASLTTNEGFEVSGGNCKVDAAGIYCIAVDYLGERIVVEPAKVYGIGVAFGGWTPQTEANLFKAEGQKLVGKATADGNIRTYVDSKILDATTNWWHAEFIPQSGSIVYRGTGGDPADVAISAGQTISYDFNAGTAVVE